MPKMKKLTEVEIEKKLKDGQDTRCNLIQGLHSYNILKNPEYQKMFQYGDFYISGPQSDIVKMVFELPYMPEQMRKDFKFDTDFVSKAKK